jgi:cellulose synthase/poly-beta-1,6-N-acetylglucosamine synthase-like glycosyltransferase
MAFFQYIFWISCFLVFYNYAGYVIIVKILNKLKKPPAPPAEKDDFFPTVSFIVAAYNEEDCITQKILNSLEQDYPKDQVEFVFITDGSTDGTAGLVSSYPSVRALHLPERKGKSAAINRAVRSARNGILIFSDANTILNKDAIRNITRHYQNPSVGGVAGEKKVLSTPAGGHEVGDSEGLYWKYESYLKKMDSEFYSVVGAAGELFSCRTELYDAIPDNVILDDFICSMRVTQKGYRVIYEPEACAMELPSFSIGDEQKRKIRIAAGGFQSIGMLIPLLAFWKYPRLSFLYISHRVLRWTLSPLSMILAFITAGILSFGTDSPLFRILFIAQLAFYGTACAASLFPTLKERSKLAKLSYYFAFMNFSVVLGFFRFLRGRQAATWEKARRATA